MDNNTNQIVSRQLENRIMSYLKENVELEVRFGLVEYDEYRDMLVYQPRITARQFELLRIFLDKANYPKTQINSVDENSDVVKSPDGNFIYRKTTIDESTMYYTKKQLNTIFFTKNTIYPIKISLSEEKEIESIEFSTKTTRYKNRTSYEVDNFKIDLTEVVQNNKNQYEIELEATNNNVNFATLNKLIIMILKVIWDTEFLYDWQTRRNLISYVNQSLNGKSSSEIIDDKPLVQARNLKFPDLTYGGLVGNKETSYRVTYKADGLRKLLVVSEYGVFLVSPPGSVNLIYPKNVNVMVGSILDGEYINEEDRHDGSPKEKFWYMPFDTLATINYQQPGTRSDTSIQKSSHDVRMKYTETLQLELKNIIPNLSIAPKNFKSIENTENFYKVMIQMFAEQSILSYKQDGFMFIPLNKPYFPSGDIKKKRILTEQADICKWKPNILQTIDLLVEKIDDDMKLYMGKKELFVGSKNDPYSGEILKNQLYNDIKDGYIVEFQYIDHKLVPYKIRHDKRFPNGKNTVMSVWESIINPVDEDTLKGNNLKLMRKYHNKIKRNLLAYGRGNLLDLGGGIGGDVSKWDNFNKIITVEPDTNKLQELTKRIQQRGAQNKIKVINAKAQDTDIIIREMNKFIGSKVDMVSMMNVLTFITGNEDDLNDTINTINSALKVGGYFIFMTLDGDSIQQRFNPTFNKIATTSEVRLEIKTTLFHIKLDDNRLLIRLDTPTVAEQEEWLVYLDDLIYRLKPLGFNYEFGRADAELFMNPQEYMLSSLYTYGNFQLQEPEPNIIKGNEILYKIVPENVDTIELKRESPKQTNTTGIRMSPVTFVTNVVHGQNLPVSIAKRGALKQATVRKIPIRAKLKGPVVETIEIPKIENLSISETIPETITTSNIKKPVIRKPKLKTKIVIKKSPCEGCELEIDPIKVFVHDNELVNDDVTQNIVSDVYRIATLDMYHAILKSVYPKYAVDSSYSHRSSLVEQLRNNFSELLSIVDALKLSIILVKITNKRIEFLERIGDYDKVIVIAGAEPLAVKRAGLLQTVFLEGDEFINNISKNLYVY